MGCALALSVRSLRYARIWGRLRKERNGRGLHTEGRCSIINRREADRRRHVAGCVGGETLYVERVQARHRFMLSPFFDSHRCSAPPRLPSDAVLHKDPGGRTYDARDHRGGDLSQAGHEERASAQNAAKPRRGHFARKRGQL